MIDVIDSPLEGTLFEDTRAPVFAAVYQDYIPRHGLEVSAWNRPWSEGTPLWNRDGFFIECASMFVEGTQVGRLRLPPRDVSISLSDPGHRPLVDFLEQILGYYKHDVARDFLAYGQLMRPLEFSAPSPMPMLAYRSYLVRDGAEFPALYNGVFRNQTGELGIFLANASVEEQEFRVDLAPARHGMGEGVAVDVTVVAPKGTSTPVAAAAEGPLEVSGTLPARSIRMYHVTAAD
jgi:hypothetical protein